MAIQMRGTSQRILLIIAVLAAAGCFDDPNDAEPDSGTVVVDPNPDEAMAPWQLALPDGYCVHGAGDSILSEMEPGRYILTWMDQEGWISPDDLMDSLDLAAGETDSFKAMYIGRGTVVIEVQPEGIDAQWRLSSAEFGQLISNGDLRLANMPPGSYTIEWWPHSGFITPSPNPATGELAPQDSLIFRGEYAVSYHQPTDPDSVVANFVRAWRWMDFAAYSEHILYDGIAPATDGATYAPFVFYCAQGDPGQQIPEFLSLEQELTIAENMFSGQVGSDGVPGIEEIELDLDAFGANWANPVNPDHVEGDPYPAGTRQRYYSTDMLVLLKSVIEGTDIIGFVVTDRLQFHVIPIQANDRTEYRIWKWRDITDDYRTESANWTMVKLYYQ